VVFGRATRALATDAGRQALPVLMALGGPRYERAKRHEVIACQLGYHKESQPGLRTTSGVLPMSLTSVIVKRLCQEVSIVTHFQLLCLKKY